MWAEAVGCLGHHHHGMFDCGLLPVRWHVSVSTLTEHRHSVFSSSCSCSSDDCSYRSYLSTNAVTSTG